MAALDLRPLSLGELLDRTFFLYRRRFLLFAGIAGIPYSLLLVVNLLNILFSPRRPLPRFPPIANRLPTASFPSVPGGFTFTSAAIAFGLLAFIVAIVVFATSFGAAVLAVSEIYLGRPASIADSMRRALRKLPTMIGVIILVMLLFFGGLILSIVPGIYFMCRTSVAFPAAVLESEDPSGCIRRSFRLTKQSAGRAFMIYLLTFALAFAVVGVLQFPLGILIAIYARQPSLVTTFLILMQVGSFIGSVLIAPIGTISFTLFYYDLRVRKEGFDLQMMMQAIGGDPVSPAIGGGASSVLDHDVS